MSETQEKRGRSLRENKIRLEIEVEDLQLKKDIIDLESRREDLERQIEAAIQRADVHKKAMAFEQRAAAEKQRADSAERRVRELETLLRDHQAQSQKKCLFEEPDKQMANADTQPNSPCPDLNLGELMKEPEQHFKTSCEIHAQEPVNQEPFPTPIIAEPSEAGDSAASVPGQCSTQVSLSHGTTSATNDASMLNHGVNQQNVIEAVLAPGMAGGSTDIRQYLNTESAGTEIDLEEALRFEYYQEPYVSTDDDAETLLLEMDLAQLYEFASALEDPQSDAARLKLLGSVYYFIFLKTGSLDDIQKGIDGTEKALSAINASDTDHEASLRNLIVMLIKRFECTRSISDLDQAIFRGIEMCSQTLSFHPDRGARFKDLLLMKMHRARLSLSQEDLVETMHMMTEARSIDETLNAGRTDNVRKLNEIQDLSELHAIMARKEAALAVMSHNDPWRGRLLSEIALCFEEMFKRTDNVDYLQSHVMRSEEAVLATTNGRTERSGYIDNLSSALYTRFQRMGDLNDLQKAIAGTEEAIEVCPSHDNVRGAILSNLSSYLYERFIHTGDLNDLRIAISRVEEAISVPENDSSIQSFKLNGLSLFLKSRYERTGDLNDLNMAIARIEEAMSVAPPDDDIRGKMIANLAILFDLRYNKTSDPNDLQTAITRAEEAIGIKSHDQSVTSTKMVNLSKFFHSKFLRSDNLGDLQKAIEKSRECIEVTPNYHPARALAMGELGKYLLLKFTITNCHSDSEQAIDALIKGSERENARPSERFATLSYTAYLFSIRKQWPKVSHFAGKALDLLPRIAPRQLAQRDQQYNLGRVTAFAGLSWMAASAALDCGKDAFHALKLLELARGVIVGSRFGMRSDLTELREQHREMADKFERLRNIIDSPNPSMPEFGLGGTLISESQTNRHHNDRHNANLELDKIIDQIRQLPGFERFLCPPQADEMMNAASPGPIVVINVGDHRCDAILVDKRSIRSIRLTNLRKSDVEENVAVMRSIRSTNVSSLDNRRRMTRMLEWLWDVAVCPILNELEILGPPPDDEWPHIWWIPTGPLSLLPLHAAGYHSSSSTQTALDRIVSSYSPSIKALLYARQKSQKNSEFHDGEALLASMETTPGQSDLRFAGKEVDKLDEILPDSIQRSILERPCKRDVLAGLSKCSIFHFAGHGESHPSDPSRSALLTRDWKESPLTVEDLMGLNMSQNPPCLAYLSACSTSESQAEKLYDEGIHLVTAFQLAGFQHVVGSLWEVSDQYSVDAAEEVYKTIGQGGVIDIKRTALGVHNAARLLRRITSQRHRARSLESSEYSEGDSQNFEPRGTRRVRPLGQEGEDGAISDDPLVWAAYIHAGP